MQQASGGEAEILRDGRSRPAPTGQAGHGWLAAVVPADARRFRVADEGLAATLAEAGAELVHGPADVEIGRTAEDICGDASTAVVAVERPLREGRPLVVRALSRLVRSLGTRARAARARRDLRRRGYEHVSVLVWDLGHRVALPGMRLHRRGPRELMPERAVAIGRRGTVGATVLDAALAAAGRETAVDLRPRWLSVRSGLVVVAADEAILRVAVGRGALQIENHLATLEALTRAEPPQTLGARVPWPLAHGRAGLGSWSLERRLAGRNPARGLTPQLLEDCVDFLVELFRVGPAAPGSLTDSVEALAGVCRPESASLVQALGRRLDQELAATPRGFGHGDFFAGNLLAERGRLTGVLDWDAGGPGRLPLVDLCHLQLTRVDYGGDEQWGGAVLDRLLPMARSGGDPAVRHYCGRAGLDPDPRLLEALVLAYWLGYAAYQLRTHPVRRSQPAWIEGNVELVLAQAAR